MIKCLHYAGRENRIVTRRPAASAGQVVEQMLRFLPRAPSCLPSWARDLSACLADIAGSDAGKSDGFSFGKEDSV